MLPFLLRFEFRKAEFAEEAKDSFASFLSSAKRKRSAEEARSLASSLSFARQNSGPLTRSGGSSPKGRAVGDFFFWQMPLSLSLRERWRRRRRRGEGLFICSFWLVRFAVNPSKRWVLPSHPLRRELSQGEIRGVFFFFIFGWFVFCLVSLSVWFSFGLFVLRLISLSVWLCAHAARAPHFCADRNGGKSRLRGEPLFIARIYVAHKNVLFLPTRIYACENIPLSPT